MRKKAPDDGARTRGDRAALSCQVRANPSSQGKSQNASSTAWPTPRCNASGGRSAGMMLQAFTNGRAPKRCRQRSREPFVPDEGVEQDDELVPDDRPEEEEEHRVGHEHGGLGLGEERLSRQRPGIPPGELVVLEDRETKRVRPRVDEVVPIPSSGLRPRREHGSVDERQKRVVRRTPRTNERPDALTRETESAERRRGFVHGMAWRRATLGKSTPGREVARFPRRRACARRQVEDPPVGRSVLLVRSAPLPSFDSCSWRVTGTRLVGAPPSRFARG